MQKPFFYTIVGIWESILPWRFGHGQCKPKGGMDKSYQLCNQSTTHTYYSGCNLDSHRRSSDILFIR